MLNKAIQIATDAHKNQIDKDGSPYILHSLRVMFSMSTELEKICAVLHDVIKDTHITLDYLRSNGFSEEVLEILNILTKKENETYNKYINRIIKNKTACYIKLADLDDNIDILRIDNLKKEDIKRVERYTRAKKKILKALVHSNDEYREIKKYNLKKCYGEEVISIEKKKLNALINIFYSCYFENYLQKVIEGNEEQSVVTLFKGMDFYIRLRNEIKEETKFSSIREFIANEFEGGKNIYFNLLEKFNKEIEFYSDKDKKFEDIFGEL